MQNMFRRRKAWHSNGDFPTPSVQRLPFQRHNCENKIVYTTRYEAHNEDKCGIFEYDILSGDNEAIALWKDVHYFPRWDVTIYNARDDTIIFVGGANVKNHHHRYDILCIYNLTDNTLKKLKFPLIIGGNGRICLSDYGDNNYLHIIGGTSNDKHILYDISLNKLSSIYSFYDKFEFPQIQSCGLIYSSLTNEILMFGGRSSAHHIAFDDLWSLDLNNNLSILSMKDCCWLLINGWIVEEIYYKNDNYNINYPVDINDIILTFYGINNTIHIWQKYESLTMPSTIYQFGYILYKERIIITFGGRDESNECIDNIFYLDLLNKSEGWKESKIKCPKPSTYNALLMDDKSVHIIPFYVHSDHFNIPISKLLPSKLIDQINLEIYAQQNNEFNFELQEMIKLQYKYLRNKIILSILIGIIIICIGIILYFTANPNYAAIIIISIGLIIIICSCLYHRCHKPSHHEYLLY